MIKNTKNYNTKKSLFRKYKPKWLFFKECKQKPFFRKKNSWRKKPISKNESNIKAKIINLSTHKLNRDQINPLKLGLKFSPLQEAT